MGLYYDKISAHIPGLKQTRDWWLRRPFELVGTVPGSVLLNDTHRLKIVPMTATAEPPPRIAPTTQVFSRPVPGDPDPELRLVTIAVVNQATGTGPSSALFQMGFDAAAGDGLVIEPYPEVEQPDRDEEGQSIDLLYRKKRTYAIGHGCAADWGAGTEESVPWVRAEPLPAYEVVSLTPNVYLTDGAGNRVAVTVSMEELANETAVGRDQVETVLRLYEEWISARDAEIPDLPARFQAAAHQHVEHCREALARMQVGWAMVGSDAIARRAFQLANQAMLYQQVRSRLPLREVERGRDDVLRPVGSHPDATVQAGQGQLAPLPDRVHPGELARTGGTDPAGTLPRRPDLLPDRWRQDRGVPRCLRDQPARRRLRNPDDAGTDTLMRYTLRLLTAQQFLRAASLICVLEDIRADHEDELGDSSVRHRDLARRHRPRRTPGSARSELLAHCAATRRPRTRSCCSAARGAAPRWEPSRRRQERAGRHRLRAGRPRPVVLRCVDVAVPLRGREGLARPRRRRGHLRRRARRS